MVIWHIFEEKTQVKKNLRLIHLYQTDALKKNGNLIFFDEDKMRFENLNNLMRGQSREEEIDASSSN